MSSQVAIAEFSEASGKKAAHEFIKLPNTVLAAAVGVAYFLAALLSYGLLCSLKAWPYSGRHLVFPQVC